MKIAFLALFLFISSFSVFPATATETDSLIKSERFPAVYYFGNDGKRYVFPNEDVYYSWYQDFSGVSVISEQELANIPMGGNAFIRPGTKLVKTTSDPAVYAVEPGGRLRKIANENQAQALYGTDWKERVVDIPDSLFVGYEIGQPLGISEVPVGSLVKETGDNKIYYFDGVYYRHISDMETFDVNRFEESNLAIASIPKSSLGNPLNGKNNDLLSQIQRRPINTNNQASNNSGSSSSNSQGGSGTSESQDDSNSNQGTSGNQGGVSQNGSNNPGGSSSQGGAPSNQDPPSNQNNNNSGNSNQNQLSSGYIIHSQNFAIPANIENGDVVGEINRFWKDLNNLSISYSIQGGNGAFEVDDSGIIKVKDSSKISGGSMTATVSASSGGKTEKADMNIRILPLSDTIFIDPSASANGNGSREQPYKSWKGISISSNKNYLQKRGTSESLQTRINIGDKNNVLLGAYGNQAERPKVEIFNLKGGTNAAVSITGSNNTVRDLVIDAKLSTTGIYSGGGDNIRIENVKISNSEWGLRTMNAASGFKLLDSEIGYTGDDGHYSQNHDNMEIAYNHIHHVNQHWNENSYWYKGKSEKDAPGDGIQLNGTIKNFNIHHNIINRSDTDNKFCVIVSPVQNNDNSNGRLEYNHCTLKKGGNESGFYIFHGVFGAKVRYNTFVDGRGIWSHSKDLIISNNTFLHSTLFAQYNTPDLVFDNDFRN